MSLPVAILLSLRRPSEPQFKLFWGGDLTGQTEDFHGNFGIYRMPQNNSQIWPDSGATVPVQGTFDSVVAGEDFRLGPDGYHFLNWEQWAMWWQVDAEAVGPPFTETEIAVEKYALAAERHKAALVSSGLNGQKFSFYARPPINDWYAYVFEGSGFFDTMQLANDLWTTYSIADHLSFAAPGNYTLFDEAESGKTRQAWVDRLIRTVAESRRLMPGKPVYPFLWPRANPTSGSSLTAYGLIPVDFWRLQLETCYDHADGIILWDSSGAPLEWTAAWDEDVWWWRETLDFMRSKGIGVTLPSHKNYVQTPHDPTTWPDFLMTAGDDSILAANGVTIYEINENVFSTNYPNVYAQMDAGTPTTGTMRFGATVKALGRSYAVLQTGDGVNSYAAIFNLATGDFEDWYIGGAHIAGTSATIVEVETGIYEVEIVVPANGAYGTLDFYPTDSATWSSSHNGDIAKGLYVGGAYGYTI